MKIYYNNKRDKKLERDYEGKFTSFKRRVKSFFRKCLIVSGILVAVVMIFEVGGMLNPTLKYQTVIAEKEVELQYPVLDRIAKAESYDSQFCTKEIVAKKGCHSYEVGAVLIHINNNGSYDIGRYAINSTHLKEALAQGYDVYQEKDNFEFAKYLFRNFGSEPWSASKINWRQ